MLGVVYLLVISQANERKEQTLNKGCAFSGCSGGKQTAMGSARLSSGQAGRGQPELCHGVAQGGRSPVVNGQVLLLLVGMTVALLAGLRKMPRRGWDGKLNSILWVACPSVVCRSAWPGFTALFHFCWRKNRTSGLWGS